MSQPDPQKPTSAYKSIAVLLLLAGLATAILQFAEQQTQTQREQNNAAYAARQLTEVLNASNYDTAPGLQTLMLTNADLLGSADPLPAYPVFVDGQFAAIAITVMAVDGYVGPITLQVGIASDGKVLGVRAIAHRETPGLGDKIDIRKSDWIERFAAHSLYESTPTYWQLRRDGGEIDQISGATITSRAVVNAVLGALQYFELHRDELRAVQPDAN